MTTAQIIAEFTDLVNVEQEYTLSELKSILSDIYKVKNGKKVVAKKTAKKDQVVPSDDEEKPKKKGRPAKTPRKLLSWDANGDVKKKREPSAYNIFIKEKYAEYKKTDPELSTKEIMLKAAADWSEKKLAKNDEKVVEATSEHEVEGDKVDTVKADDDKVAKKEEIKPKEKPIKKSQKKVEKVVKVEKKSSDSENHDGSQS